MKTTPLPIRLLTVLATAFLLAFSTGAVTAAQDIFVSGGGAFGNVLVNTNTSTKTFTISNPGDAGLTLAPTINGADASEFIITTPAAGSVAAKDSTTLIVTCIPTSPGAKSATLSIANNVAGKDPTDIPLTATGTAPDITVDQAADDGTKAFGSV
ncbi:MAG: choice-of-anchor D domain-containing protein, partial [Akkermansiaceae bacterium]|nr:choice-of-anchor D domain-containing protein [Akkermansiaceae bacterium]